MDRGAWWATVHGVKKSWTWLNNSDFHFTFTTMLSTGLWKYEIQTSYKMTEAINNQDYEWNKEYTNIKRILHRFDNIYEIDQLSEVAQSCLTLCNPVDCNLPGSSIHGILQARTLEWVAISFSNAWEWKVKVKSLSRVRLMLFLSYSSGRIINSGNIPCRSGCGQNRTFMHGRWACKTFPFFNLEDNLATQE